MPDPQSILQEARDNLELCKLHEVEIRKEADKCNRFLALEQWNPIMKREWDDAQRPALVIDQLRQYKAQVVNDWRRDRMGIKVSPADAPADPETARIIDGTVRQIEYLSKAHVAYDHAFECMAGSGRGFCKVTTARRKGSFRQDIQIKKIPNPDCVYMDPFCREIDYSDMTFCLILETINRKHFKKNYPKATAQDFEAYSKEGWFSSWFPDSESMVVAEYWRVEERPRKIQKLTKAIPVIRDGKALTVDVVYDDEYGKGTAFEGFLPEGVEIAMDHDGQLQEDDEPERIVSQYMLSGVEAFDKTLWLGAYIPVVPWLGPELYYEGKRKLFSVISGSLDAQQLFNYAQSSMAERLGLSAKSPVMGIVGQFKTQRASWEMMTKKSFAFIEYDPVTIGDRPAPPPQRADFDPRIDQMVTAGLLTKDNIRGTIGLNTNVGGQDSVKAKSGVALRELKEEGDNATFDFLDNGGRALELVGCIIVDLIPKVMNSAELIQIRDSQDKVVQIAVNQDISKMENPPKDQERSFFLNSGAKYSVAVSAAPSHQTLRQEGVEQMGQLIEFLEDPTDKKKAVTSMLRLSEFFGSSELADELDPPKDKQPKIPPQVQEQMGMMQKMISAQTEVINELQGTLDAKKLEIASKEKISDEINAVKIAVEKIEQATALAVARINAEVKLKTTHEQLTTQEQLAEHTAEHASSENQADREHAEKEAKVKAKKPK